MRFKANYPSAEKQDKAIRVARGLEAADLLIKNAWFLDVFQGQFVQGDIALWERTIVGTGTGYSGKDELDAAGAFVVPGFIDTHVHIESSLLTPGHFADTVLPRGTTTAIWDPHEIANVKGLAGIEWALAASEGLALDIFIMLPSCVPATSREGGLESGAHQLKVEDLLAFKDRARVLGLAEMMDYPSVLSGGRSALDKLLHFGARLRDGHCPGLSGKDLNAYAASGIYTCHESTSVAEAQEKLRKGIHVLIREGSCAKNAACLLPLVNPYSSAVLALCSDDRNPVDIAEEGHLDALIKIGLAQGQRPEDLFRIASFSAARLYGLNDRGVIAPGYLADLCILKPPRGKGASPQWQQGFSIEQVIKAGKLIAATQSDVREDLAVHRRFFPEAAGANIRLGGVQAEQFVVRNPSTLASLRPEGEKIAQVEVRVIGLRHHSLLTDDLSLCVPLSQGEVRADLTQDVIKISVIERHQGSGYQANGFVRGFKLREGAFAATIAHDCHNILVVGVDAEAMAECVNYLRAIDGGIVVWKNHREKDHLALPLGGLMSLDNAGTVAAKLTQLINLTKTMGCVIDQPFIQLSFLSLPVIGALKITDRGLVEVSSGKIISVLR